jgi:hypothetical protein
MLKILKVLKFMMMVVATLLYLFIHACIFVCVYSLSSELLWNYQWIGPFIAGLSITILSLIYLPRIIKSLMAD